MNSLIPTIIIYLLNPFKVAAKLARLRIKTQKSSYENYPKSEPLNLKGLQGFTTTSF